MEGKGLMMSIRAIRNFIATLSFVVLAIILAGSAVATASEREFRSVGPARITPPVDGIHDVSPVAIFVPGHDYTINGVSFGDDPGTVALVTSNKNHSVGDCNFAGGKISLARMSWRADKIIVRMPSVLPAGSTVCSLLLRVTTVPGAGGFSSRYDMMVTLSPPQTANP